jgi:putative peptidoglycan lipid II flippase
LTKQKIAKDVAINFASRIAIGILGLLQLTLIARAFGASHTTDAYMVAKWIPLFVLGSGDSVLSYSLVPYLVGMRVDEGQQSVKEKTNSIFSWFFLSLCICTIVIYVITPYLIRIIVPGFPEETKILTIKLLRWLCPAIFIGGLSAFSSSLLFAVKKFSVPAIASLFPYFGGVVFILIGVRRLGIMSVIVGFSLGILLQLIMLHFAIWSEGILPRFSWKGFNNFKKVLKLIAPRSMGAGLNAAVIGVDRFFASMLGVGAVSVLAYSYRLSLFPFSLAVGAFGKTLMPTMAKAIAQGEMDKIRTLIPRIIGIIVFGVAPVILLLIFFSEPIIRILYQRGSFTSEAAALTANLLVYYSLAILFRAIALTFSGIFFASGDTVTPFKITCISLLLNAALDYIFMRLFGIVGIALSTLGVALLSMILLHYRITAHIGKLDMSSVFRSLLKIAVATIVMGITIWGMKKVLGGVLGFQEFTEQLVEVITFSLLSWSVFIFICRILKLEEFFTLRSLLKREPSWQE